MRMRNIFVSLLLTIALISCASSGEVVKIIPVEKDPFAGLAKEDRAKLEEIKKADKGKGLDPSLRKVLQKTQSYSASEYLKLHPEKNGSGIDYKIGGYDILSINVYEEKDLSREDLRVAADGSISFPLIGRLQIAGLTSQEVERLISRRLAEEQYLLEAHVSVTVKTYLGKQYLILGAVKKPGSYPVQAQERVLDALSKAEGFDFEQGGKRAMIIRTEEPGTDRERKIVIELDLQSLLKGSDQVSNILLAEKDVLYIPPKDLFYIIGQVKNPGSYPIRDKELTLVEAISTAGGFTPIAARNGTRIVRVEAGVEQIIEVRVDAITKAGKKIHDVLVKANDIIVVPESFF